MEITHCQQIFDLFPSRFRPEGAVGWNAVIQFRISGPKGGDWFVAVADGQCQVSQGLAPSPTATLTTSDETYIGMVTGKTNPMIAFSLGKVKMQGNTGDILKLSNPEVFQRT